MNVYDFTYDRMKNGMPLRALEIYCSYNESFCFVEIPRYR